MRSDLVTELRAACVALTNDDFAGAEWPLANETFVLLREAADAIEANARALENVTKVAQTWKQLEDEAREALSSLRAEVTACAEPHDDADIAERVVALAERLSSPGADDANRPSTATLSPAKESER